MVAYNFKADFTAQVASGQKCQTIRPPRGGRGRARICDRLQLYSGQRTAGCLKLVDPDPICVGIMPVTIQRNGLIYNGHRHENHDTLARNDGFKSFQDLADWFEDRHGLPFQGTVIMWSDYTPHLSVPGTHITINQGS